MTKLIVKKNSLRYFYIKYSSILIAWSLPKYNFAKSEVSSGNGIFLCKLVSLMISQNSAKK